MREQNIRAKIFACTDLIGQPGYCTWDDLRRLSKFHDIENHGAVHKDHSLAKYEKQFESIEQAQKRITRYTGKSPRYFVPPYNQYNADTEMAALKLGLILVKDRVNVLNISK